MSATFGRCRLGRLSLNLPARPGDQISPYISEFGRMTRLVTGTASAVYQVGVGRDAFYDRKYLIKAAAERTSTTTSKSAIADQNTIMPVIIQPLQPGQLIIMDVVRAARAHGSNPFHPLRCCGTPKPR